MVGSLANERMTYTLAAGGGHDYGRLLHAFLVSSELKGGQRVIVNIPAGRPLEVFLSESVQILE
jgi:hypothetical protein